MSNEEFERKMEFILGQQAQFSSDIQILREAQSQTDQLVTRLANVTFAGFKDVNAKIDALVDSQIALTAAQSQTEKDLLEGSKDVNAKIDSLVDSQIALTEAQNRTDENLKRTDEHLKQTDENIKRTDEHLKQTDENIKRTTEDVKQTTENVKRTDESLRNLIALVDRYLREGRNGESRH